MCITNALVAACIAVVTDLCLCQQTGPDVVEMFKDCKMGSDDFDNCVKNTLNSLQKYFPTGLPQYNVGSFDPFFASEVNQKRGGPNMNYRLKLKNVYEMGWSKSHVTKFRSDPRNYMVKYSQFFPEKFLEGDYEIEGRVFDYPLNNKGQFNITLYNYTQTTTAVRRPHVRNGRESTTGPVKVKIEQDGIGDMKLHISNLLRGRSVMENILDGIINVSWRPFLPMVKPLIDDLVSTAFTDIFNKNFQNFPFEEVFPR